MLNFIKKIKSRRNALVDPERTAPVKEMPVIGMPRVVPVVDEVTGLITHRVQFVTDYGPDRHLKVSDFALQNLLASGAKLTTAQMSQAGFSVSDSAIKGIESIDYSKADPQVTNPKKD